MPDADTIWTFREALTWAKIAGKLALDDRFQLFDAGLGAAGFLAVGGQIIDAWIATYAIGPKSGAEDHQVFFFPGAGGHLQASADALPQGISRCRRRFCRQRPECRTAA